MFGQHPQDVFGHWHSPVRRVLQMRLVGAPCPQQFDRQGHGRSGDDPRHVHRRRHLVGTPRHHQTHHFRQTPDRRYLSPKAIPMGQIAQGSPEPVQYQRGADHSDEEECLAARIHHQRRDGRAMQHGQIQRQLH